MSRARFTHLDETVIPNLNYKAFRHIFPTDRFFGNPYTDHVLTEDYLSAQILPDGSLQTRTFVLKNNKIPKVFAWAWPKGIPKKVQFVEEINMNYAVEEPTINHLSRNIDKRGIMVAHECVNYRLQPRTEQIFAKKSFMVDSPMGFGAGRAMRGFGIWRYDENEKKANKGLDFMCNRWQKAHSEEPQKPTRPCSIQPQIEPSSKFKDPIAAETQLPK